MNVLFLSLLDFKSINERNIYTDLLREFLKHNISVYAISPVEKKTGKSTELVKDKKVVILKLKIGNVQKTNPIEKGLTMIALENQLVNGIRTYFSNIKFDLVLYATPPITFQKAVEYVKKRDGARTYLLLKDIFPQNSVDMQMLSKKGIKGCLYSFFRRKEEKLYSISDRIGCMSQANVDYIVTHNPKINPQKVEVCPNSIEVKAMQMKQEDKDIIRRKYDIPLERKVFVYGGNLGKPQGIPFLKECLKMQVDNEEAYFLIVGDGTEFHSLKTFFDEMQPKNMRLMRRLPKEDYENLVMVCDVGMIFLDHQFTIPNFPSRLLSYMQAGLPVLACTDPNTDIGKIIVEGGFGWWCESNNVNGFNKCVKEAMKAASSAMGTVAYQYLVDHYDTKDGYQQIMGSLKLE